MALIGPGTFRKVALDILKSADNFDDEAVKRLSKAWRATQRGAGPMPEEVLSEFRRIADAFKAQQAMNRVNKARYDRAMEEFAKREVWRTGQYTQAWGIRNVNKYIEDIEKNPASSSNLMSIAGLQEGSERAANSAQVAKQMILRDTDRTKPSIRKLQYLTEMDSALGRKRNAAVYEALLRLFGNLS